MKIIEVLNMVAEGKIEKGTKFILGDNLFIFNGDRFKAGNFYLGGRIFLNARDLNREVDLILPKPKKYLIKLNVKWLKSSFSHVNYVNRGTDQYVLIGDDENLGRSDFGCYQTQFTKKELQSIKPVKEFLDDMQGKYELVEVTENEDY